MVVNSPFPYFWVSLIPRLSPATDKSPYRFSATANDEQMTVEVIELRVSTVLEHGKADFDAQHLAPPTPRQWSAAVGGYRLQLPTGASRPPTGVPGVSPRLQLRLPPIDDTRASPRGSRRASLATHACGASTPPHLPPRVSAAASSPAGTPAPLHLCPAVRLPSPPARHLLVRTASSPLALTSEPRRSSTSWKASAPPGTIL